MCVSRDPVVHENGDEYAVRSEMQFSDDSTTRASGENHACFLWATPSGRDGHMQTDEKGK